MSKDKIEELINTNGQTKEIGLGEMINVWIEHNGYLDMDTPKQNIIEFYSKVSQQTKEDE